VGWGAGRRAPLRGRAALHCADARRSASEQGRDRFPQAANQCIFKNAIRSWRPLDAYRLKVFADREYVVELAILCDSLTSTETISFRSRDSEVCDYRADELATESESCPIGSIRNAEAAEKSPLRELRKP
jgi:hypothetical protein